METRLSCWYNLMRQAAITTTTNEDSQVVVAVTTTRTTMGQQQLTKFMPAGPIKRVARLCPTHTHTQQPQCIKNWKRMQTNDIIKTQERRERNTRRTTQKNRKTNKAISQPQVLSKRTWEPVFMAYSPQEPESVRQLPCFVQSQSPLSAAICATHTAIHTHTQSSRSTNIVNVGRNMPFWVIEHCELCNYRIDSIKVNDTFKVWIQKYLGKQ